MSALNRYLTEPLLGATQRYLDDESSTLAMGAWLSEQLFHQPSSEGLQSPWVIFLEGDLGAGKTTLSRAIIQHLGHKGAVKSPTYTLVEPYQLECGDIYHFDLYRLADPQELEFMGFDEYFEKSSLCIIEWSEKAQDYLPEPDWVIRLALKPPGRQVSLEAYSERALSCL